MTPKQKENQRKYRLKNKEKIATQKKDYYTRNRERLLEYSKAYQQTYGG